MYRRFYTLGFLLVVLAALAGFYLAGQLIGPVEVPRLAMPDRVAEMLGSLGLDSLLPALLPATSGEQSQAEPQAPIDESSPSGGEGDGTAETGQSTDVPSSPTPPTSVGDGSEAVVFAFGVAGELRHSTGDCSGPSIRGMVRSATGEPLAEVRLWRYDQWGNEDTTETKASEADLGQYDFPLGDTTNVHYVQIVDASGSGQSPSVEVVHRQGVAADAECHWLDWVAR